jgi:hypothetical protein
MMTGPPPKFHGTRDILDLRTVNPINWMERWVWRCRRFRFGCRDPVCSDRVAVGGTADLHGATDREPLRVLDGLLLSNCVWGVVVTVYAVPLLALTVRVGPFSAVIVPLTPRACRPYPPRWCCRRDAPQPRHRSRQQRHRIQRTGELPNT